MCYNHKTTVLKDNHSFSIHGMCDDCGAVGCPDCEAVYMGFRFATWIESHKCAYSLMSIAPGR